MCFSQECQHLQNGRKKEEEEGGIFIKATISIAKPQFILLSINFLKKLFCKIEFSPVKAVEF